MIKAVRKAHLLRFFLLPLLIVCAASSLSGCIRSGNIFQRPDNLPTSTAVQKPMLASVTFLPTFTLTPTTTPTPTPAPTATPAPTDPPPGPVTIDRFPISSSFLGNSRTLSVYLPGSYGSQPQRRYKVLYANDGQDLDGMGLKQDLDAAYAARRMDQIIVVGIPASDDRANEYGTGTIKDVDGAGGRAQQYINFLTQEVIPLINSRYRTSPGPENTAIMGWSLGGLTAFYVGWQYPSLFGITGAFSGSFWWRTNVNSLQELLDSRVAQKMVRDSSSQPPLRMWFSAGTGEFPGQDRDNNGTADMVQDTTDLVEELAVKGYQEGRDYLYEEIDGGTHDQSTWATVLPDFLEWAFPPSS